MTTSTPPPPRSSLGSGCEPPVSDDDILSATTIVLSPTQLGLEVLKGLVVTPTDQLAWPCRLSTPSQGGQRPAKVIWSQKTPLLKNQPEPPSLFNKNILPQQPPKPVDLTQKTSKKSETPPLCIATLDRKGLWAVRCERDSREIDPLLLLNLSSPQEVMMPRNSGSLSHNDELWLSQQTNKNANRHVCCRTSTWTSQTIKDVEGLTTPVDVCASWKKNYPGTSWLFKDGSERALADHRDRRFKGAIGTTSVLIVLLVVLTFDVLILLKEHAELCRPLKAVNSRAALSASFEKWSP